MNAHVQDLRERIVEPCPACQGRPNVRVASCPYCTGPVVAAGSEHVHELHTDGCIVLWLRRAAIASENARAALKWKI